MSADQTAEGCWPVTVHSFGLEEQARKDLMDRVSETVYPNITERLFVTGGGGTCHRRCPDWADVREAARKAGYRLSRRGPVDTPSPRTKVVRWDLEPLNRNPDGDPGGGFNLVHWWQVRDGEEDAGITVEIDLDDYNGTEAHVWDATPARAMHAARLVGLGGDSDA
jgi:hypothetical protein